MWPARNAVPGRVGESSIVVIFRYFGKLLAA